MNQRKYALELISECGLGGARPVTFPLDRNVKLTSVEYDKLFGRQENDHELEDTRVYQRLIDGLLYRAITRTDISFAVQTLSQFINAPKQSHYEAALRVVRFVKNSPGKGLLMGSRQNGKIMTFCDADWAS